MCIEMFSLPFKPMNKYDSEKLSPHRTHTINFINLENQNWTLPVVMTLFLLFLLYMPCEYVSHFFLLDFAMRNFFSTPSPTLVLTKAIKLVLRLKYTITSKVLRKRHFVFQFIEFHLFSEIVRNPPSICFNITITQPWLNESHAKTKIHPARNRQNRERKQRNFNEVTVFT